MNLFSYFESASDGDALVMPKFYCNIINLNSQHVSCEILVFFCTASLIARTSLSWSAAHEEAHLLL